MRIVLIYLSLLQHVSPKDNNGYQIISKALEDAAKGSSAINDILSEIKEKTEAEPKFVEVTIRSLGMTPEKFTTGGSPSATADVIRKLAGDPFDDEPKYGTVRCVLVFTVSLVLCCSDSYLTILCRHTSSLGAATRGRKRARLCLVCVRSARSIQ